MRSQFFRSAAAALAVLFIAFSGSFANAAESLPSKLDTAGMVMVQVTPLDVSPSARAWRFEIAMNTHVTPLDNDMTTSVVLIDDSGKEHRPTAWDGDPAGGHHRVGMLSFDAPDSAPTTITMKIRNVGAAPERVFEWQAPQDK